MSEPREPPIAHTIQVANDDQDKLLNDIPTVNTLPLWKQMSVLVPPRPGPKAIPHKWA
jgi:gentisate 1,2-dioxygenase